MLNKRFFITFFSFFFIISTYDSVFAQTTTTDSTFIYHIKDKTKWAYKGNLILSPAYLQMGFGVGLINLGGEIEGELAMPKFLTFNSKFSWNYFEIDRVYWKQLNYLHFHKAKKGKFNEIGLKIDIYEKIYYKDFITQTPTKRKRKTECIIKTCLKDSCISENSIFVLKPIQIRYYEKPVYKKTIGLRAGLTEYRYIFENKQHNNEFLSNIMVNGYYGGFSFSKTSLGDNFKLETYLDIIIKQNLTSFPVTYLSNNNIQLFGGRIGYFRGGDKRSSAIEFGLLPGIDKRFWYLKITVYSYGFWFTKIRN